MAFDDSFSLNVIDYLKTPLTCCMSRSLISSWNYLATVFDMLPFRISYLKTRDLILLSLFNFFWLSDLIRWRVNRFKAWYLIKPYNNRLATL